MRYGAISPAAVQAARRRDPERTVAIFEQVQNKTLLRTPGRHRQVNRAQLQATIIHLQPVKSFQSPDPDRAFGSLAHDCDGLRTPVFVFRHNHCEHRCGAGRHCAGVDDTIRRFAFRVEPHKAAVSGYPKLAPAHFDKVRNVIVRQALFGCVTVESR